MLTLEPLDSRFGEEERDWIYESTSQQESSPVEFILPHVVRRVSKTYAAYLNPSNVISPR